MAEPQKKSERYHYFLWWLVLGAFLIVASGGVYALLHGWQGASIGQHKQAGLQYPLVDNELQSAVIPVEGMTCAACASRVKRTLQDIEGVASAEVSLTERNVKVRYVDNNLSSENLVAAINALGYKAQAPIAAESETTATNGTSVSASNASESQEISVAIPVTGMVCEYCVKTVEESLRGIDGVTSVWVSLTEKTARIRYVPGKVPLKRITDEIETHGFKAGSPVKEEAK